MKKIVALVLAVLLMCMVFCGCGSSKSALETVKKNGKLVMATSPDFPPFENLENGEVVGIEVDVLKLVAEKLGVELVIEQMDFDSVLPGVQAGKYDIGASGITITEQRAKNVDFTDPYCLAAQAIVVTAGSPIASKADLEGKAVSVQTGTTAESYTMENGYEVQSFAANSDAELALTTGKVDAWVIDDLTAADMVAQYNAENGEGALVILDEAMTTEPYAFAFHQGNEDLVEAVNTIINEMISDGTIASIFESNNAPYTAAK